MSDIEKADANLLIEEFAGYDCWQVLRDDFSKAVVYTRREQIAWDGAERGEFGEILKARGGVYKLTGENKKLGRVGQKYGEVNSNETDAIKHRTLKEQAKEWPKSDKFRGGEKKEERKRVLAKTLYAGKEFYDNDGEKVKVLSVKRDTSGMLEVQVMVGKKEDHWYVDPKDDVNAG